MAEYIDRKLLEMAMSVKAAEDSSTRRRTWVKAIRVLRDIPVADVAPVVHAKWIVQEKGYGDKVAICSHCGENAVDLQEEDHGHGYNLVYHRPALTKCCPNCGARMDKEDSKNE